MSTLRAAGLPAVVSGAGPTVLVLARDEAEVERPRAERAPPGWRRGVRLGRRRPDRRRQIARSAADHRGEHAGRAPVLL